MATQSKDEVRKGQEKRGPLRAPASGALGKKRHKKDRLAPGNLLLYVAYALLLHLLFFGLSAFTKNLEKVVQVREIPVELMGVENPSQPPPDKGRNKEQPEPEPASEPEVPPPVQAKTTQEVVPEQTEAEPVNVAEALEAIETNSKETVFKKGIHEDKPEQEPKEAAEPEKDPPERKKVSIAAAAARAAGRRGGIGAQRGEFRTGRGGLGEGFGIKDKNLPVISGGAVFGSGKRGALKGVLCFIPVGTKRLSDIQRCPPAGVMYTNTLNIEPRRFSQGFPGVSERYEWFAIDYKGRFTTSKAGTYKFRSHSDDGTLVWIDGKLIINNDGIHADESKVSSIELEEGKHRIRVFYFQGPRFGIALQLFVTPPGGAEQLWSPKL